MDKLPPITMENYREIIEDNYYYIDKTLLVKDILESGDKNIYLSQPFRFGKSINISMLKYFLEDTGSAERNRERKRLFDNKLISKEILCQKEQCKNPVISLTLKPERGVSNFVDARKGLAEIISREFKRHEYIKSKLKEPSDYELYSDFEDGMKLGNDFNLANLAIPFMSHCLSNYFHKKCIILIDDCNLLLFYSKIYGYYDEMYRVISDLVSSIAEDKESTVRLAVFAGSPVYGTKNLIEPSEKFDGYFGFTEEEVQEILCFYGKETMLYDMKSWCGGYKGNSRVETFYPPIVVNTLYTVYTCPNLEKEDMYTFGWFPTCSITLLENLKAQPEGTEDLNTLALGGTIRKKQEDSVYKFLVEIGWINIDKEEGEDMILELPNQFIRTLIKMHLGYDYETAMI